MKEIPLTQGQTALVDDVDYDTLSKHRWYANRQGRTWYAVRKSRNNGRRTNVYMHRQIMGDECCGKQVDHKDGNGTNNQRSNLRACSCAENSRNRKTQQSASRFKGVVWSKQESKWKAQLQSRGNTFYLGYFDSEEDAARAYDAAAIERFGQFVRLNFPVASPSCEGAEHH